MMAAIDEYLPVFRKYLRKKGGMLGHVNGLPWYDLFAPLGKADKTYKMCIRDRYRTDYRSSSDLRYSSYERSTDCC